MPRIAHIVQWPDLFAPERVFDLRRTFLTAITASLLAVFGALPGGVDAASKSAAAKDRVTVVPVGNRLPAQPEIPISSIGRTKETKGSFEGKYKTVYDALSRDKRLISKIKTISKLYGIDPLHMIGAIVGEHTYNVDAMDHLQTYYIKALEYAGTSITFSYKGVAVTEFVERDEFKACKTIEGSNDLWTCREAVWNDVFRGRKVGDVRYENVRFGRAFFQPLFAGQTFGLGQLNPLTALKMNDLVVEIGGHDRLNPDRAPEVYRAIMDPDSSLHYVAAVIRTSIDSYRAIAEFDISKNPGITATLYNVGNAKMRAAKLKRINRRRRKSGRRPVLPIENYYGWLINDKVDELRKLL